jgi:hypothetical protein
VNGVGGRGKRGKGDGEIVPGVGLVGWPHV